VIAPEHARRQNYILIFVHILLDSGANAPGKGYFALGKAFTRCNTRQRASDKKKLVGKDFFTRCFLSGSLHRLVSELSTLLAATAASI
jgi:hypothetical protein